MPEKIYSIFEAPYRPDQRARCARRGNWPKGSLPKRQRFDHPYEVLKGKPYGRVHVAPSLKRPTARGSAVPRNSMAQIAASSASKNVAACDASAVQDGMYSPARRSQTAATPATKESAAFTQGQRFRAGIEGRISVYARSRHEGAAAAEGASASRC